jgi:SRSO17 transposase
VFLAYASQKGAAFIDRELYLPEQWASDPDRRAQAGVSQEVVFESKIELAEDMLDRAFEAQVPARWVVADSFYGRSGAFRGWLEERGQPYAVMVPKTNAVPLDGRKKKIEQLVEQLPEDAYSEVTPAQDTGERRPWEWACIELSEDSEDEDHGMRRWLLVRRGHEDPEDIAYWLAYGPPQTPTSDLVRVCDARWTIEECFSQAKGEVGLDQYEVRRWDAWHRYVTLCLLAHAFLAVTRLAAHTEEEGRKKGISTPV